MKKRDLIFSSILLLIVLVGFAKAQSMSDLLSSIDQSTVVFFAIFLIAFGILFFSLNKIFKGSTSIAGIISAVLSFLIVYGINKSGFDAEELFSGIGISEEVLSIVLPILILAGIVFLIVKFARNSLFILGGLFIFASFFVYEKITMIAIGIILILIAAILAATGKWGMKRREER